MTFAKGRVQREYFGGTGDTHHLAPLTLSYSDTPVVVTTYYGVHSNQGLMWSVKTGVHMVFWVHCGF